MIDKRHPIHFKVVASMHGNNYYQIYQAINNFTTHVSGIVTSEVITEKELLTYMENHYPEQILSEDMYDICDILESKPRKCDRCKRFPISPEYILTHTNKEELRNYINSCVTSNEEPTFICCGCHTVQHEIDNNNGVLSEDTKRYDPINAFYSMNTTYAWGDMHIGYVGAAVRYTLDF